MFKSQLTFLKLMYCLMASILFLISALPAFMLVIIDPMLPTMVAKMSTPIIKSNVTNTYSMSFTGWGVSPKENNYVDRMCLGRF